MIYPIVIKYPSNPVIVFNLIDKMCCCFMRVMASACFMDSANKQLQFLRLYDWCTMFYYFIPHFAFYSSCVTWSTYHKSLLASSDYEGTVTLWDAFTGTKSKVLQVILPTQFTGTAIFISVIYI